MHMGPSVGEPPQNIFPTWDKFTHVGVGGVLGCCLGGGWVFVGVLFGAYFCEIDGRV